MEKYKVIKQRAAALVLSASMLASLVGCAGKEEQKGEINELAQEVVATTVENSEELYQNAKDMIIADFLAEYGMTRFEFEQLLYSSKNGSVLEGQSKYQIPNGATKQGEAFNKVVFDIADEIKKNTTDQELLESIDKDLDIYINQPDYNFHKYVLHDILSSANCSNMSMYESSDLINLNNLYYFNNCGMFQELHANEIMLFEKVLNFGKYDMYGILGHESGGYLITDHDGKMIAVIEGTVNVVLDNYDAKIESFKSLLDSMNMSECAIKLHNKSEFMSLLMKMNMFLNGAQEEKEVIASDEIQILVSYSSPDLDVELTRPKYRVMVEQMPYLFESADYIFYDVNNSNGFAKINMGVSSEGTWVIGEYFDLEKQQINGYYGYANDEMMPLNLFLETNGYEDLIKEEYTKEDLQNIAEYLNQQFKLSRTK